MFTVNVHFPDKSIINEWSWMPPFDEDIYIYLEKKLVWFKIIEKSNDNKDVWVEYSDGKFDINVSG